MADPLSAAGLAFAVVAAFKDVYSTVKFIKEKIDSLMHFQKQKSTLIAEFEFQIARLETNSRILSRGKANGPDVRYLQTLPTKYIKLVRTAFAELQEVLAAYIRYAAEGDNKQGAVPAPSSGPQDGAKNTKGSGSNDGGSPAKWYNIVLRGLPQRGFKGPISLDDLPAGVRWLFSKEKMEQLLKRFKKWNKNLEYLIPVLLEGFSISKDIETQNRLKALGDPIEGHLSLIGLSHAAAKGTGVPQSLDVPPITWEQAQEKLRGRRTLTEEKRSGVNPSQMPPDLAAKALQAQREIYTPQLARLLRKAGAYDLRTLALNAYAWDPSQERCFFFFDYPDFAADTAPQSLYDLISSSEPDVQLDLAQRFYVASILARCIGAFHCDGWVHKGIRASAVKFFFDKDTQKCDFTRPYLTEFEYSRPDSGLTALEATPLDVEHDVYRHPLRHGLPTPERFTRTFDIYSLGVVLLEIGLWQTAKEIYGELVSKKSAESAAPVHVTGNEIKEFFELKAQTHLRHRMGPAYQEAVMICLNCGLDEFLYCNEFAGEFQRQVVEKVNMRALLTVSLNPGHEHEDYVVD
ncbi:hypothetical protein DL769_011220 [Monosporascus sp. CRB-8-3]|nr:hypothetical protein DL769_011220 [Monosporascus sp. CRB-8-3]